jgi:protein-arginine kinase activator protein McsA
MTKTIEQVQKYIKHEMYVCNEYANEAKEIWDRNNYNDWKKQVEIYQEILDFIEGKPDENT